MENKTEDPRKVHPKKQYVPEKYIWKRSYTYVLVANALYIAFFYFLTTIFR